MANSKDYWEKRERERMDIVDEITNEEIDRAIKDVNAAYAEVQEKITNIYVKYAKDNKLDYSDALKYLKDDERKEFQKDLKYYTEKYHDSEYVKENKEYLHALSARTRVKRLEELQATLKTSADTLYRSLDKGTRASLKTALEENYKHTAFSILNGKEAALNVPSDKDFAKLMDTPWSGKNYSEKIWDTANNFESKLSSVINKGLIQGKSYEEMARDLRHAQVGKDGNGGTVYECKRLISTEAAFIQQQGTKAYYDEIGLDEYEYCATLDNKTSDICQALDGKLIKVDEARVGVNYPPMHCGCRSTTLPVVRWEGEELGEDEQRMERGDDGRNRIISKVSYDEWKNKRIQKAKDTEQLNEKVKRAIQEAALNEPSITNDIEGIANEAGTSLQGLEFRKKQYDSLSRKVKSEIASGITLENAMKRIYDNVRYTNISSSDNLVDDYFNFVEKLKDKGYNMRRVKNTLKDENVSYRGINAIVENSEGYKFELQFHTQESFNAKQANHILYEEQRLDVTSTERIIELGAEMTKNNSKIGMPSKIKEIIPFDELK